MSVLVEAARQERQRREATRESAARVFTSENVPRRGGSVSTGRIGRVGEVLPEGVEPAGGLPPAEVQTDPADSVDPIAALAAGRRRVQELADQEVRLQLEINRFRNEFLAPVGSQTERDAALAGMNAAEADLESVRARLAEAREALQAMERAAEAVENPRFRFQPYR
jgi:hypothetical protein